MTANIFTTFPFYNMTTPDIFNMHKYINMKDESLVYGYIRMNASSLQHNTSLNYTFTCSIPEINLTCLWYYLLLSTFEAMNLKQEVVAGAHKAGYQAPSAMQQLIIISMIQKKDIIVQSKAKTGKTAAYLIASLQMVDLNEPQCQILIMVPSRVQFPEIYKLSDHLGVTHNVSSRGIELNSEQISKGTQIVVGTVHNIQYMIQQNVLSLQELKLIILDNVNQMITTDIYSCFKYLPINVQIALITVRMSNEIIHLTHQLMKHPERILMKNNNNHHIALHNILHYVVTEEHEEDKLETLYDLLEELKMTQTIIYCNTPTKVIWLRDKMGEYMHDFSRSVSAIYSDMSQKEKEEVLMKFKNDSHHVIITTDISSCEYDVSLIINYDLPMNPQNYIHRIGPHKSGAHGVAINFLYDDSSLKKVKDIEQFYSVRMDELPLELDDINSLLLSDTIKTIEIN